MKDSTKKILAFAIAFIAAFAIVLVWTLPGCASLEQRISDNLSTELDKLKYADEETIESMAEAVEIGFGPNKTGLIASGITGDYVVRTILDGLDYEVDDVTIDGNSATVTVEMRAKNVNGFYDEVEAINADILAGEWNDMGIDEVYATVGERIRGALETLPLAEKEVEFEYRKKDGKWELTAASGARLASVFLGD